jgi:hypothetical protein
MNIFGRSGILERFDDALKAWCDIYFTFSDLVRDKIGQAGWGGLLHHG